jgi:acetyltransferase
LNREAHHAATDLSAWHFALTSRDGAAFAVRPIHPDDTERERAFITGLSEESRYNRLMYSLREPSAAFLRQLVSVDYRRSMAFVAVVGEPAGECFVGVARYASEPAAPRAEFAVVVADAWQGRGVGTQLANILFDYAGEQSIATLFGTVLASNERMIKLVHFLGLTTRPAPDDATLLIATLDLRTRPRRRR